MPYEENLVSPGTYTPRSGIRKLSRTPSRRCYGGLAHLVSLLGTLSTATLPHILVVFSSLPWVFPHSHQTILALFFSFVYFVSFFLPRKLQCRLQLWLAHHFNTFTWFDIYALPWLSMSVAPSLKSWTLKSHRVHSLPPSLLFPVPHKSIIWPCYDLSLSIQSLSILLASLPFLSFVIYILIPLRVNHICFSNLSPKAIKPSLFAVQDY